jgi:hypothetical protein
MTNHLNATGSTRPSDPGATAQIAAELNGALAAIRYRQAQGEDPEEDLLQKIFADDQADGS